MSRGVNLTHWFQWSGSVPVTAADRDLLQEAGFDHVRLCLAPQWVLPRYTSEAAVHQVLERLDAALAMLYEGGLAVMLCLQADGAYRDDLLARPDAPGELVSFWASLARRYGARDPEALFFEIMNEPDHRFLPAYWDELQKRILEAVRREAPEHTVLLAPVNWSSLRALVQMTPYEDRNAVYVFHYYNPYAFTHQGAGWAGNPGLAAMRALPYPADLPEAREAAGALADRRARTLARAYIAEGWGADLIDRQISLAAAWARGNGVRVVANEFGVFKPNAPEDSRRRWIRDVRAALERRGIGWTLWDYAGGFDLAVESGGARILDPGILEALGLARRE